MNEDNAERIRMECMVVDGNMEYANSDVWLAENKGIQSGISNLQTNPLPYMRPLNWRGWHRHT